MTKQEKLVAASDEYNAKIRPAWNEFIAKISIPNTEFRTIMKEEYAKFKTIEIPVWEEYEATCAAIEAEYSTNNTTTPQ